MNRLAALLSCLVVLCGCDKEGEAPKPADAPAADKKDAAPAKPKVGIELPGNDPKIVEGAKKALGCKWEDKNFDPFDTACPELKAWVETKEMCADKKTLVAMIEDPDDKVRYLGLKRLDECLGPPPEVLDKELVTRVLDVAEKHKVARDMTHLGVVIGDSNVTDPEVFKRVSALVGSKDTNENLRNAALLRLVRSNPDSEDVWKFTVDTMNDTTNSKMVQRSALEAFERLAADKPARCDVFQQALDNPPGDDVDHAGDAMGFMSRGKNNCTSHFDKMLASFEARVKAKKANSALFLQGGRMMCPEKGGKATPAHVKKLVAIAKKVGEDKTLDSSVRQMGLETVSDCDPKGKKAYLARFLKDKDAEVKSRAQFLTKKK